MTKQLPSALIAATVLALLTAGPVPADLVHLTNGRVLEGQATRLDSGEVRVTTTAGSMTLPGDMVARIERAETIDERVQAWLREHPSASAEDLFELAQACRAEGAETLAVRLLRRVLLLDHNHEGARRALGFTLHEGRWLTEEELHAARGEIRFRGRWVTAQERSEALDREARRAEAERAWLLERRRLSLLEQEIQARERQRTSSVGIPYGAVWLPSSGPVLPPAFVPLPQPPPTRATPPPDSVPRRLPSPPPREPATPPAENRGRFSPPGG